MIYTDFVNSAIQEDKRNEFGSNNVTDVIPASIAPFYNKHNPLDVEVTYPTIGAVKFYSLDELAELQQDYQLPNGCFVFATCNGDPIFLKDEKVFTSLPEAYRPELLADSFENFLNIYVSSKR